MIYIVKFLKKLWLQNTKLKKEKSWIKQDAWSPTYLFEVNVIINHNNTTYSMYMEGCIFFKGRQT